MRTLQMVRPFLDQIQQEARGAYPDEACGFLFSASGEADEPVRRVSGIEAATNSTPGERRRRFVITPTDLAAAEQRAERRGELVSGFYHSHPDHPAVPSAFDTEHAWPWYAYVVVAVDERGACGAGVFELDAGASHFLPRRLEVISPRPEGPGETTAVPSRG